MTTSLTAPGHLVAGRYRLLSQVGGGGMGTVWLSRDELLGRQVAVKQMIPPAGADQAEAERQKERALREGRIAARLSNPHAISVYDVALEGGQPWLVMEYLPSRSLAAVLAEDGLLRIEQAAQVGAQVADALAATHAAGIVHRDVKPANILIGRGERVEGIVKITDFGISHASGDVTLTQTGQITGTPAFLAPEVAQGEEPLPPSDVFSLGATLYTCLEGTPPFGMGENALQLLHRVASGQVEPPRHAGLMTRPLLRMLEADPAVRPSMEQVRDDLARLAAGRDGDPTTILMARTNLRPAPGRSRTAQLPPLPPLTPVPDGGPSGGGAGDGAGPAGGAVAAKSAASAGPPMEPAPTPAPAAPDRSREPAAAPAPAPAPAPAGARRRRRFVPIVLAVIVLIALVTLGVVLLRPGARNTNAQNGSGTSSSAAAPSSSAGGSASSSAAGSTARSSAGSASASTSAGSASGSSSAGGNAPAGAASTDPATFLADYHALLPGNTQAAYAMTGPTLRANESYPNYQAFWAKFRAVRLTNVQSQGPTTLTGELDYTLANGSTQRELHRFTLVRGQNGALLLDRDEFVQAL